MVSSNHDWQNPTRRSKYQYFGHTDHMVLTAQSPVAPKPPPAPPPPPPPVVPPPVLVKSIIRRENISNPIRKRHIEFGHTHRMRMPLTVVTPPPVIHANVAVTWTATANNTMIGSVNLTDANGKTAAVLTFQLQLKP